MIGSKSNWRRLCASALWSLMLPVSAQTQVGISIGIHQPGVYGRIDIGNFPPPPVVYPHPMVITPSPVAMYQKPIYLYVPPGQANQWDKHCSRYNACGQPVYFVQEDWVRERYEESHRSPGREKPGRGPDKRKSRNVGRED